MTKKVLEQIRREEAKGIPVETQYRRAKARGFLGLAAMLEVHVWLSRAEEHEANGQLGKAQEALDRALKQEAFLASWTADPKEDTA